jgi:hypothetical protein
MTTIGPRRRIPWSAIAGVIRDESDFLEASARVLSSSNRSAPARRRTGVCRPSESLAYKCDTPPQSARDNLAQEFSSSSKAEPGRLR